ncbi:probable serine/threonine-protein kinase WNK5 isoform X2 [Argentina anserina]|uniref:probable serine/threonine-protein kinase WNK5 isoform X2 n=1 Tax=Argentina anserina TaxID=57926 RepID=UPI0021765865|nr:probable serine/threonine-protein kinase WNK5 isoform X2 [Potentilla anserina]
MDVDMLGKGAMKTVYKAFDEVLGMEVAWNQVKLNNMFGSPEELQRLYSEVHLLKNLNHDSIIHYYTSWIDIDRRTFNFITEMFTSGTLREYRQKYQRVSIGAVKNWARQILRGLAYLHKLDPPVIHRDLKCDNIFVNGHLGQIKIGDLGLAAILRGTKQAHSVIGTPEFMAPELYDEEYNELVDIYAFGMCVLEMVTSEYPYNECSNPAQIYKKVTSGKLPKAYYKIEDLEAQRFVGKCLVDVSKRLPAHELLLDPFLASDDEEPKPMPISRSIPIQKIVPDESTVVNEPVLSLGSNIKRSTKMIITGSRNPEDDAIYLKVRISDNQDGHARNIYFPFDIVNDTAMDVAVEMVKELEISDWEPSEIAVMIEKEISSLVPSYNKWGSPQDYHSNQHCYSYEDDDGCEADVSRHPFQSFSSCSSSQNSLPAFGLVQSHSAKNMTSDQDWFHGDLLTNDDASSQSSLTSCNYSNMNYHSGNEDDYDLVSPGKEPSSCFRKTNMSTRFCPSESTTTDHHNKRCDPHEHNRKAYQALNYHHGHQHHHHQGKLPRIRSLVDVRSQLLHRSLVEEITKRRLCNTVGAVENIGFQAPEN